MGTHHLVPRFKREDESTTQTRMYEYALHPSAGWYMLLLDFLTHVECARMSKKDSLFGLQDVVHFLS